MLRERESIREEEGEGEGERERVHELAHNVCPNPKIRKRTFFYVRYLLGEWRHCRRHCRELAEPSPKKKRTRCPLFKKKAVDVRYLGYLYPDTIMVS